MNPPDESSRRRSGYNPRTGAYHLHHDWDDEDTVIETVLRAVAAIRNLDPTELECPNDTLDTDALSSIFRPLAGGRRRNAGFVSFPFNGCNVVVHADGEVEVYPPVAAGVPRLFGDHGHDTG